MGRPPAVELTVEELVGRVRHATLRIIQTTKWALAAKETWLAFRDAHYAREMAGTQVEDAAIVYESTTKEAVIVRVCRALDEPGRYAAVSTNRMSHPVCRQLIEWPGVLDRLAEIAVTWNERGPDNEAVVRDRFAGYCTRLDALREEQPNRCKLVRDFRDENIAHELRFDPLPERPRYTQVWGLLDEVRELTDDLALIVLGQSLFWQPGQFSRSATMLWDAVQDRYPPLRA